MHLRNRNFIPRITIVIIVMLAFVQISLSQDVKVLFLGNSYTGVNDLPELVTQLAISGNHTIYTDRSTPGGYTLGHPDFGHLYNALSLEKIAAEKWDFVVLQEQSQFPIIDHFRDNYTFPGAIALDSIIEDNYPCTQTLFYMTWGRKYGGEQCIDGYCSVDFADYAHMQDSLASSYMKMSDFLETPVSPVGISWKKSIIEYGDPIELFSGDASHPSIAGSYLAACTFYAAIFQESPVGLSYFAGLTEAEANYLQNIADETVMDNLELWNIDTTTVRAAFEYNQVGGELDFENLSVNADNYFWNFGNGDTDTTANPTYTYTESGQFEITLVAMSGCKIDSVSTLVDIVISDIFNVHEKVILSVYPNPASGKLSVDYTSINCCSSYSFSIMDMVGNVIGSYELNDNKGSIELDIEGLNNGVYTLLFHDNISVVGYSKFVKM